MLRYCYNLVQKYINSSATAQYHFERRKDQQHRKGLSKGECDKPTMEEELWGKGGKARAETRGGTLFRRENRGHYSTLVDLKRSHKKIFSMDPSCYLIEVCV